MKVYIVGAGAVGRYLGELLRATGNDVAYAPRELAAVEPVAADLVLVTVKAYDTDGAIETLRRALGERSSAVDRDAAKRRRQRRKTRRGIRRRRGRRVRADRSGGNGSRRKIRGVQRRRDRVRAGRRQRAQLAARRRSPPPASRLTAAADYRALKWSKLVLNVIANASCAILNVLPERLVHSGDAFELELRSIREVRAVMKALGIAAIDLPRYPVRALQGVATLPTPVARTILANRIAGARGRKPPSLLLDLRAMKNRTEVDYLNGAVARAARPPASRRRSTPCSPGSSATSRTCPNCGPSIANGPTRSAPK